MYLLDYYGSCVLHVIVAYIYIYIYISHHYSNPEFSKTYAQMCMENGQMGKNSWILDLGYLPMDLQMSDIP